MLSDGFRLNLTVHSKQVLHPKKRPKNRPITGKKGCFFVQFEQLNIDDVVAPHLEVLEEPSISADPYWDLIPDFSPDLLPAYVPPWEANADLGPVWNGYAYEFPNGMLQYHLARGAPVARSDSSGERLPSRFRRSDKSDFAEIKRRENVSRARQELFRIAYSNVWDWFVTLTYSSDVVDRYSYKPCFELLHRYCHYLWRYTDVTGYLFVPELHKDGAIHFHGLIQGDLPVDYWMDWRCKGGGTIPIYNVHNWRGGFITSATRVQDQRRVSGYIAKYISKDMLDVVPKGCRRYLPSSHLLRPVKKNDLIVSEDDYEVLLGLATYKKLLTNPYDGSDMILIEVFPEVK